MSKENKKIVEDGQNRCRRCDRPLSNPNDVYGWRCAQIVGANKYNEIASMLDENSLNVYNAYVSTYLVEDDKTFADNSGKFEKVAWMDKIIRKSLSPLTQEICIIHYIQILYILTDIGEKMGSGLLMQE